MVPLLILGYVLSAGLPLWGLARLLLRAQATLAEARERSRQAGTRAMSYANVQEVFSNREEAPGSERNSVIWDLVLIGGGLIIGAATSIAALPGMLLG